MSTNILTRLTDWWQSFRSPTSPAPPPAPIHREPDVLEGPPMVGDDTLRDWMIHHHRRNTQVWQAVVSEFYNRATHDPQVAPYFHGVDIPRLQNHFLRGLVVLTHIGLTMRKADELRERHAHLHITGEHFDRVVVTLVNVFTDYGVPRVAIPQLAAIAAELRKRIVTA